MQPVGGRLQAGGRIVGQLAVELVLACVGGEHRVVLEGAIDERIDRRFEGGAVIGDGCGRGLRVGRGCAGLLAAGDQGEGDAGGQGQQLE